MPRTPILLSRNEAAALLDVSPNRFSALRRSDETFIPIHRAIGKANYYKRADVLAIKKCRDKKKKQPKISKV